MKCGNPRSQGQRGSTEDAATGTRKSKGETSEMILSVSAGATEVTTENAVTSAREGKGETSEAFTTSSSMNNEVTTENAATMRSQGQKGKHRKFYYQFTYEQGGNIRSAYTKLGPWEGCTCLLCMPATFWLEGKK